jgi:precorrin-6B methylase 2
MNPDDLFSLVQRLNGPMEGLGALGAELRIQAEGLTVDPTVRAAIAAVLRAAGVDPAALAALPQERKLAVAGGIRAFLRQSVELVERPDKPPGWTFDDPEFLQSQGRMSMPIADIVAKLAPSLGDLASRLAAGNAAFLDVGVGVAWLSIAMAEKFPGLRVVGLDVFPPALALARQNVASASLAGRIELRQQSVVELRDTDVFDVAFIAGPFLQAPIVSEAIARTTAALKPGGVLLFGMFATVDEALPAATQALRVVRSGGHPWNPAEVRPLLEAAGLREARVLERTWQAPVSFVAGLK